MDQQVIDKNLSLLVGQDQAKRLLSKCLIAGNCSAYLLVGPPHVGKGFLARLMTASLHAETNVEKAHPDTVVFNDILAKNSGEDEENQWKKSVGDFIHAIYLSPVKSPVRVGILEDIDRFSTKALNALLKTLEEPPARAVLIISAQEISNILPTILSRAQMVRLNYLADLEIAEYLRDQGAEKISEITRLANGAVGMANRLHHQPELLDKALRGVNNFQIWLQKDISQMLQIANVKDREEAIELVHLWLNLARRAWLAKLNQAGSSDPVGNMVNQYSPAELIRLIDRLKLALSSLEANANVRITLESTVLSVL